MANEPQVAKARISMVDYVSQPQVMNNLDKVKTNVLDPDKVVRLTLNAMQKTPGLQGCTLESMLGAMMTATSLGLEPNTPLGHSWIIPYDNYRMVNGVWGKVLEADYMIGYKGFINLMHRSENLMLLKSGVACENDEYESYLSSECETGTFFKHQRARKNRGALEVAYCFTRMKGKFGHADMVTELSREDIEKIRSLSKTHGSLVKRADDPKSKDKAKAQRKLAETPWVFWEEMMWMKSAVRRHASQSPLSPLVMAAAQIDGAAEDGRLDISQMADPKFAAAVVHGETDAPVIEGDYKRAGPPAIETESEPAAETAEARPGDTTNAETKKRGRGRPPGSTKAAKVKAAEVARAQVENAPEEDGPPRRCGRGRSFREEKTNPELAQDENPAPEGNPRMARLPARLQSPRRSRP